MKNLHKQKGIISIIAVLGVGIFALASSFTMAAGVFQQLVLSRNNISTGQAFYAAEAGALEGVYQAVIAGGQVDSNDEDYEGPVSLALNMTTSDMEILSEFGAINATGEAWKGDTFRKVSYLLIEHPGGTAFSYALYTPSVVEVSGNATVNGNVFAAGGVNPTGDPMGSAEINGDIVDYEDPIPPQLNDDEYYNAAMAGGTYFDNATDAEAYLNAGAAEGDIVFVDNIDDDRMIIGNDSFYFKGSLWVTGDLKITGGTFNSIEPWVLIIVEGDLEITGNPDIYGIVYVKGNTTIGAGTVEIYGSLICVGDTSIIDVSGNITVTYDENIVNFWDEIVGLEEYDGPPIIRWEEE